jgi:hypothetical protein
MRKQKINLNNYSVNPLITKIIGHEDSVRKLVNNLSKLYPKAKVCGECERVDNDSLLVSICMLEKKKGAV